MKKKIGIALFASSLIMVNSVSVVSADGGASQGTGSFEGNVSTNVINVDLPTLQATDEQSLAFILDPNDLIPKSKAAKYASENASFSGDKGFYFKNASGNYSNISDDITAVNKSSRDISFSVEATLSDYGSIALLSDETDFTKGGPSICLKLKGDDGSVDSIKSAAPASIDSIIEKADSSAFILSWSQAGGYTYTEAPIVSNTAFKTYSFHLEGAANKEGNWGTVNDSIHPKLDIVWKFEENLGDVDPYVEDVSILNLSTTSNTNMQLNYGAGIYSATDVTISFANTGDATVDNMSVLTDTNYAVNTNGSIVFKPKLASALKGMGVTSGDVVITFNNTQSSNGNSATTITLPLTVS